MERSGFTRRGFLKTTTALGIGAGWLGGTHLYLKDDRWTPNRSFWVSRGRAAVNPPLKGAETADVAIIGGGVTGLSTALHLLTRHPGLKVVLLEAQYAGFGATGRSGGVLGDGTEIGEPEGTDDNVAHVMEIIDKHGISCDLEHEPATQLDPYKYAVGLKGAIERLGARVFEGSRVEAIRRGALVELLGDGFSLQAPQLVVATNGYTPRLGIAPERIAPVHTGAAVTPPLSKELLRDIPDAILVHTSPEMYMWGRKTPDGRVLVGAGAKYFYGDGLYHSGEPWLFRALHRLMERTFPGLAGYPFEHSWTGPMGATSDQEPIIGRLGGAAGGRLGGGAGGRLGGGARSSPGPGEGNIFYGGAYSGHGIAMGTKMGSFLAAYLEEERPPAWLLRPTVPMPPEPFRYAGVNMVINMMNLGLYHMPKHD